MESQDLEGLAKKSFGTRITPRTCLWPLTGSLLVTFGLSIGLTFRSDHHCYAGTCGEWLFPLQARLHVVIWYAWLSLSTTFFAVRAFHPEMQRMLARHLVARKLPVLGKSVSIGGLCMILWVVSLYGIVVGVWWPRLVQYFTTRNAESGIFKGSERLAAVALTGHLCDITMGMVLLPISRHSALASFFVISTSTTLTNHVLAAYTLFTLVIIHGLLYVSWIPVFNSLSGNLRTVIPVLNPTYLYHETWPGNASSLGIWRASLIFTGTTAALIMAALFITTFPRIRQRHFNLFYFTHMFSIVMVVIICLHASTMFYCTAPGLAMWVLDWSMRIYELRGEVKGNIKALGQGWYCVTLRLPRARLTGCSCRSPLAHFYIHHAGSSIRELHPFTTITHLASQNDSTHPNDGDLPIQFLFRKQGETPSSLELEKAIARRPLAQRILRSKKQRMKSVQWTAKLAALADQKLPSKKSEGVVSATSWDAREDLDTTKSSHGIEISLRLEGPYFTPADPHRYNTLVCIVAGTGISGALAIAGAFVHSSSNHPSPPSSSTENQTSEEHEPRRSWRRCIILWSVKAQDDIGLPLPRAVEGLQCRKFLTGRGRERVNLKKELESIVRGGDVREEGTQNRTWVYISGPKAFIGAGKEACTTLQKQGGNGRGGWTGKDGLDFYAASWDP